MQFDTYSIYDLMLISHFWVTLLEAERCTDHKAISLPLLCKKPSKYLYFPPDCHICESQVSEAHTTTSKIRFAPLTSS